jgi:flavin-dependent dehydrogenase
VKVAVVGAGPAGSYLSWLLARDGASVTLFDASFPREKPCGGGLTGKAVELLPAAPADDPIPARWVDSCLFVAGAALRVEVELDSPVGVAARADLDAWLLRQAVAAGARHVAARVTGLVGAGVVSVDAGCEERFDVTVGADGAGSLVRRTLLGPIPTSRLTIAAGWLASGDHPMAIHFVPGLAGYIWLFPRPGHVAVGICAPLASVPTRALLGRLEAEVSRLEPALLDSSRRPYVHTIPSPSADERCVLEIAGPGWARVGDAAGLADPITGEGIYYALRSASELAQALREDGSTASYPGRALEGFGRELLMAASLRERFYAPGFTARMVRYSARSRALRGVMADLVLGEQGYLGLKRRLLRVAPRFLLDSARQLVAGGPSA